MEPRTIRPSAGWRWLPVIMLALLVVTSFGDWLVGGGSAWTRDTMLTALIWAGVALWTLQMWRSRIVIAEDAIKVTPTLGPTRRVERRRIRRIRTQQPAWRRWVGAHSVVEVDGDDDIPLRGWNGPYIEAPEIDELRRAIDGDHGLS